FFDSLPMPLERFQQIALRPIPDLDEAIASPTRQARATRVKSQSTISAPMCAKGFQFRAGRRVPHLHDAQRTGAHELLAVSAEQRRINMIPGILTVRFYLPTGHVPDLDNAIHRAASNALAVAGKAGGEGSVCVACQNANDPSRLGVVKHN